MLADSQRLSPASFDVVLQEGEATVAYAGAESATRRALDRLRSSRNGFNLISYPALEIILSKFEAPPLGHA